MSAQATVSVDLFANDEATHNVLLQPQDSWEDQTAKVSLFDTVFESNMNMKGILMCVFEFERWFDKTSCGGVLSPLKAMRRVVDLCLA